MIIIKNKPIDLTVIKNNYLAVKDALSRLGIKARTRAFQSDNYSAGVAGWILKADGTIEALSIVAGNYITTYVQTGVPTSDHIGDLWIKTDDNNKIYRAACVGADAIAAGKWIEYGTLANWSELVGKPSNLFQIFYQATAPVSGMSDGDYWIDSDNNKIYRYAASAWSEVQDDDIATAITNAATAQTTADGKIYVYKQTTAPGSGMGTGDLWFDTDDGNKVYRYSGAAWEEVKDTGIATAIANAATAQSTADGKITTFIQTSAPTAEGTGDLWLDSDDGYKAYRWSGAAWVDIQDTDIASALADAATAQAAANAAQTDATTGIANAATAQTEADRKIVSFYQTSAPTAEQTGDLWFDTDDDNKPYRWSGAAWVAAEFDAAVWSKIVDDDSNKPANNATENTGALADKDAVDLATGEVTNKDIDNITAGRLFQCVVASSGADYTTLAAAISAGKKRIFVRAGTYNIASNQSIPVDTKIYGEDWDTVIFNMQNAQFQLNADDIVLRDIQLSGYDTGDSIITGSGGGIKIEHCKVYNTASTAWRKAINITGNSFTLIDSEVKASSVALRVDGNDANVDRNRFISILNTSVSKTAMIVYFTGDDILFTNNFFERTGSGNYEQGVWASGDRTIIANNKIISDTTDTIGISVSGVDTKVVNNHIVKWGKGIYLNTYYRQICSGNTIIDCGGDGIYMLGATNAGYGYKVITGNIIFNAGDDGITGYLIRVIISDNVIYNATNIGINAGSSNCYYATIVNNKVDNCGSHGIYLAGGTGNTAYYCVVNSNNVGGNTGTGIYIDATETTVVGNVTYSNGTNFNVTNDSGSEIAHNTS